MKTKSSTVIAATVAALIGGWCTAALAQSGAEFFHGRTVVYIVATDPGGGYDTYGRLVARFMQKHLPGSTFVVRNMPGAGQLVGANFIYASKPDGLTFGTFNTGLIYRQLADRDGVRFDLARMSWLGKVASDPRVIVVSKQSGIDNFEQLAALKTPVKFAAPGIGSASTTEALLLVKSLNLPIQVVTGYNGADDQLAMRRGEVQGTVGSRSSFQRFVDEGQGKFIAQIGGRNTDLPLLSSMAGGDKSRNVVTLVESLSKLSRLTAGPPDIPADRLQALRAAYIAATSDPGFLQEAKRLGLPVDPEPGEKVTEAVARAMAQTPDLIGFLKENTK